MNNVIADQTVASIIQEGINQKEQLKLDTILEIHRVAAEKIQNAHEILDKGLECVERVRDFVSDPKHILGSDSTKHGEIAEHIEVEIGNGRRILEHLKPNRTFDGVGRTAPQDYIVDGVNVQSKFLVGTWRSLDAAIDHLHTYPDFTADGGFYHIPKNQYEDIIKILNGESVEGIKQNTAIKVKQLVEQIEKETGRPFADVVRPSISNYDDVQLGKVGETLDGYETEFKETNAKEVKEIRQTRDKQKAEAQHITDASLGEALKYGAISAAISGFTAAGIKIYSKIHNGKKITEFSSEDWKDVGYDFTKGGVKGGISGLGIYSLTKLAGFSAPFAGAVVSTTTGIASMAIEYKQGKLSEVDFADSACSLSVEAGLSAIGTVIGQALIPVPVLGGIIGAATAKASLSICSYIFDQKEAKLLDKMQKEYDELVAKLDAKAREIIEQMDAYFSKLGGYIEAAMSKESAVRFYGSIELCRFLHVPEQCIIHNIEELDNFMLA